MLGLAAMRVQARPRRGRFVRLGRRLGRLVVVNQLERQLDHAQPKRAIFLRPIVAGRGQMLQEGVNDRVERGSVYGVQLGLAWFLGDRRLLWMTVGAARGP